MDKRELYKKLNAAIRADKSLDFLGIKSIDVGYRRDRIDFFPDSSAGPLPPVEVSVIVNFHSNELIE